MRELHTRIMDLWPSVEALADDLGYKVERVKKWRQRKIPSDEWPAVIEAGAGRAIALTYGMFTGKEPLPGVAPQGAAA